MAYYEGAYPQLLFGVSQQQPKDRLPGQVEEQVNMTSDPTFGVRRRSPVRLLEVLDYRYSSDRIASYQTDLSGQSVYVVANGATGDVDVYGTDGARITTLTDSYLESTSGQALQFATVDNGLYIVNTEMQPTESPDPDVSGYPDPARNGFLFITSSAYSKRYDLVISIGGTSYSVSYTTPEGADAGQVAESTVEYIAEQLVTAAEAEPGISTGDGFTYYQEGGYISIRSDDDDMVVTTTAGSAYAKASGSGVNDTGDLPALVPGPMDNLIISVGAGSTKTYYRWDADTQSWLEDAAYDALTILDNMPLVLTYDEAVANDWSLDEVDWERRTSGDTESNPTLHFVEYGITGMCAFQGRLVLLSNEFVCMSASNRPERFYRSTVESVDPSDPIEVAGQGRLAAPYVRGVVFNKDLVVFSRRYQGIVPGSSAVTPANATIAVVTTYEAQVSASPVPSGQSMFFPSRRSTGYSSVWEMTASPYVDASVIGQDVTNHIPTYIPGEVRFMTTSSSSGIMLTGLTGDEYTVLVHEYLWSGNEKAQAAWHKWTFEYPVIDAVFIGDRLLLIFGIDSTSQMTAVLDLRAGSGDFSRTTPRLDFQYSLTCTTANQLDVPADIAELWLGKNTRAFKTSGLYPNMAQEVPAQNASGTTLRCVGAAVGDVYTVGIQYTSSLVPTVPVIKDRNEVAITTQRQLLHKYEVRLANTGEFQYTVSDKFRTGETQTVSPLKFGSPELGLGIPLVADGQVYIPARVEMSTSRLELSTDDVYDLNITSLEYGYRFHQRYGRRA